MEITIGKNVRTLPPNRAIGSGLDYNDFEKIMARYEIEGDFAKVCDNVGDENKVLAEKAKREGHEQTACRFFFNASAAYRVGQYSIVEDNELKLCMYRKLIDCYAEAAKYFTHPTHKVEIPYEESSLSGWLRIPQKADSNCPAVLSIGGADGWREEHHNISEYYLERGIAFLLVDGPGQGETRLFNKLYMPLDVERSLSAAIDFLYRDDRVGKKIGCVGWSLGGYLCARTVSYNKYVKAACIVGGSYYPKEILGYYPHFVNVFSALTGERDHAKVYELIDGMTMEGLAKNITCSLLFVHGRCDPLFSLEGVRKIFDEASSIDKTLKIWDDGNHCCTNHYTEMVALGADWFAEKLA